jgi:oxygen-dependent protoporphyrinogen oxidase
MALPSDLRALLRSTVYSPLGKVRLLAERVVPARRDGEDEPLGAFVRRRLGREAFERVVEPVVGGLFTGDAAAFGARLVAPRLVELERRWGSLSAGAKAERRALAAEPTGAARGEAPPMQVAPRLGMGELVRALRARLVASGAPDAGSAGAGEPGVATGAALVLRAEVTALRRGREGRGFVIERRGGEPIECEAAVLAVPGPAVARLLRTLGDEPAKTAADAAARLGYAACATVALAYPRAALGRPLRGLGLFVSRAEGTPVLAVSYASEKLPGRAPDSLVLLRVFLGGALHPRLLEHDDAELVDLAHGRVASWLGIAGQPAFSRVGRHELGIPQLVAGSDAVAATLREAVLRTGGLAVAGSALGVYGIPDCVATARAAARRALEQLDRSAPA